MAAAPIPSRSLPAAWDVLGSAVDTARPAARGRCPWSQLAEEEEGPSAGAGAAQAAGEQSGDPTRAPRRPLPTREGRALPADALLLYGVSITGHIEPQPWRAHIGLLRKARQPSR